MRLGLLFFLSVVLASGSFGQPYIPMLGQHSEWRIVSCFGGCITNAYTCAGDTLIDGNHYQTLDGFHYIHGNFLIREDVQERKVYMKLLGSHVLLDEFPLYDFSLNDGDTTHIYNPISPLPVDGGLFVLDSIAYRPLETGTHRFFYLHAVDPVASGSEGTVWVEGVGSLSLINSPGAGPTEGDHLGCAFVDGIHRYARLDSIESCEVFNNIDDLQPKPFSLVPTIFSEEVLITSPVPNPLYDLSVYSIDGRLIYAKSGINTGEFSLPTSGFPDGLLLFVTRHNNGSISSAKGIHIK